MELVYLWVEKYKNIENQGFNFSPRFECDFDGENLTIDENKDYVSIFPDNISVTAIVGENGSGKTTILSLINRIISNLTVEIKTNYILLIRINNKIHYKSNIKDLDYPDFINKIHDISVLTYLHRIINNHQEEEHQKLSYSLPIDNLKLSAYEITQLITMHVQENQTIRITPFLYLPTKIHIKPKDYTDIFDMLIYDNHNIQNKSMELLEIFDNIDNKFHKFLFLFFIEQKFYDIKKLANFKLLKSKISRYPDAPQNKEDFKKIFSEKSLIIGKLTKKEKNIFIYKYHNYFDFNYIDEKNRDYASLSTGEQTLFSLLLNIFYFTQVSIKHNNKLLITLDEFDLSLHPNWQKKYLTEIILLLTKLKEDFHVIIASHSPFILSDLQKENIVFLEKGIQKKPFNEKEQTFGANIHTLLSHGFFMEDGLMGEFAKGKIEEIKKFYEVIKKLEKRILSSNKTKKLAKKSFEKRKKKI